MKFLLIVSFFVYIDSVLSQDMPVSIIITELGKKNFEIIIRDSTDGHSMNQKDIYYHSTTKILIKDDTLNKIDFLWKVFGDVEVKPSGDSVFSSKVVFSLNKDKTLNLFVFFKTGYYGSKLYHFQGELDISRQFKNPTGLNIIKNDRSEALFYFNSQKSLVVRSELFDGKLIGPIVQEIKLD